MSEASFWRVGLLRGGGAPAIAAPVAACQHEDMHSFQGYAQGETIHLSAPYSGNLSKLAAKRGAKVNAGTTLICGRCGTQVRATVMYISPFAQPESQTEGLEALRYLVEARPNPAQAALLEPGPPVTAVL